MTMPRRIFVQHSGYDLRNTGDAAMLEACVNRLQARWPSAEIVVICYDADELAALLPDAVALGPSMRHLPLVRSLPRKIKLGGEHAYQSLSPLAPVRHRPPASAPRSIREALATSDVVVATGGGYLCDTFWWHAFGVMSCLHRAQVDGKPTGMFGQGVGPLETRLWRRLAAPTLRGLGILTLREGHRGPALLSSMGVWSEAEARAARAGLVTTRRGGFAAVTADDALATALREIDAAPLGRGDDRPRIGINVRLGTDSGVMDASALGAVMWQAAHDLEADLVTVPVSYYDASPDEHSTRKALGPSPDGCAEVGLLSGDTRRPVHLARTTATCDVVVTGSYHAAVFALAAGTPVVGLVANDYYTYKFGGLADLYPGLVTQVRLDEPDPPSRLRAAIDQAWSLPPEARAEAVARTRSYVARAQAAFDVWASEVEATL